MTRTKVFKPTLSTSQHASRTMAASAPCSIAATAVCSVEVIDKQWLKPAVVAA